MRRAKQEAFGNGDVTSHAQMTVVEFFLQRISVSERLSVDR